MILIFTFDPLPGKDFVVVFNEPETVNDSNGFTAAMITRQPIVRGILRVAQVSCDCFVLGMKRKHYTAFDMSTTPPTLLRRDYALEILLDHGANLPPFYFDELGNLRNIRGELVMAGPRGDFGHEF